MLKTFSTKELKLWYTEAKENWKKIKKFVEKYKDDKAFVSKLKKITTPENEDAYVFTVGDIDIMLTLYPKIMAIHSIYGWNQNGNLKKLAIVVPTLISLNDKDYKEGKVNILQMFYEQYTEHLTQSLFVHELTHLIQVHRHYNYQSIQALNYTPFKFKDDYDTKAKYYNNELEVPIYALQLLWDYDHDKQVKEIVDKYKGKTALPEIEPWYKEFSEVKHKCLDTLWSQMLYHANPESTLYILDILNRMI